MTDMTQAVEVLARALARVSDLGDTYRMVEHMMPKARALLAEIAPLLAAEEREACAKVADDRAATFEKHIPKMTEILGHENAAVKMMQACAEDGYCIADAIRERGRG